MLRGDGGPLQVDAQKAAEAAAIAGGKTFNQTFGATLKKAAGGLAGAGIGAAFGVMLTGANQLDAATRQLQADTGMTADEAKRAQGALAGMYRDNLQGFDAIGAAMAKVHNDLGLTGDAADAATEKFLKFSTATKQDAAAAVASFDDILDAWNLTAADAGGLMDKLIVSHQKYGGVIGESQAALSAIAPAMQAANMTVDDGIALLNLFATSGIDASNATAMLNRAVKSLRPGQDINDLIAKLGAIEDPTLRAQEAMKIFGKQGALMANAIKPGMTSLDELKASLGDTTDATTDAAAAIEEGWGNKFTLLMKKAGGTLAEFGTQFGPLLMVASAFGPQRTRAIGAGLGGLTGILIPRVTAAVLATGPGAALAASGVGTAIGAAMGAAIPIALAAAAGLGIALAFKSIFLDPGLQKQTKDIGTAVGEQIATGTLEQLQQSKGALEKGIADINALPLGGFLYGDQVRDLQTQLDAVNAKLLAGGKDMPKSLAEGIEKGAGPVQVAVEDLVSTFGTSLRGVTSAAFSTGIAGMNAMAQGIADARAKPLDAFETMKEMLKHQMSATQEAARLAGELTSKELAAGLRSNDPEVRAQAIAVKRAIIDRLAELATSGGLIGKAAMDELNKGIRSKDKQIRSAARAAKAAVVEELNKAKTPAGTAGANAGGAFAFSLLEKVNAALAQAAGITARFGPGLPKLPIPGIPGHAVGTPFVERNMLAYIHRGEMIIPAAASAAVRAGQAVVTGGGNGGGGLIVNVYNPTPEPASTSTKRELRKLALSGVTW
jgi:hypothetical protein